MTLDQMIAVSASVAAALSAFATLLTVREIVKQRQASYRPELVFEGRQFNLKRPSDKTDYAPGLWSLDGSTEEMQLAFLKINLLNIGLGAAKAVTLTWSFDVEKAVQNVNKAVQRSLAGGFVENDRGIVSFNSRGGRTEISMWENQKITQVDFILPSDNKKQIISVNIPNAYLMLVTIFAHYMTFTEVVDDLNIPPLRARIDYGDIGEKIFSLEYDFTFSVSIIKNNGADVSGLIKATRVEKSPLAIGLAKEAALISASMVFPGADNFISAALSLGKRQKK